MSKSENRAYDDGVLSRWALLMSETYAKQNDCEQSEYYRMAQYFKEQEKKRGETR